MRSQVKKQGKLMQIFSAPIKILSNAQNFYLMGMEDCARRVGYGAALGCPSAPMMKSFSVNSSRASDDEELRQLLCAASTRNMLMESDKLNSNISKRKKVRSTTTQPSGLARSYSVSVGKIGRIDEDKPCSFEEDDLKAILLYPRGRSHMVRRNFVYQ